MTRMLCSPGAMLVLVRSAIVSVAVQEVWVTPSSPWVEPWGLQRGGHGKAMP